MGGIGGFVGAPLTESFKEDKEVRIIFICRGLTKAMIRANGLTLSSGEKKYRVHPYLVSDDPEEIGTLDILIIAVKSYGLKEAVKAYEKCIGDHTVIIPLQNVVNGKELISESIGTRPGILEGCIYVASNIENPGFVKHLGGPGKVFFGNEDDEDYKWVADILKKGGIDATYTRNIKYLLWKKYLFVSPVAAITTAFRITFGQLEEDKALMATLKEMMEEVCRVALQHNVSLTDKDIGESLGMLGNFPYEAKSSLQLDFEHRNSRTEKYFLVDYIVENGRKSDINVEAYRKVSASIDAIGSRA